MADLLVAPLPPAEDPAAQALLCSAFHAYPAFCFLVPDDATRRRFLAFYFARYLQLVRAVDGSFVLGAWVGGNELAAVSLILPPNRRDPGAHIGFVDVDFALLVKHGFAELPLRFGGIAMLARTLRLLLRQEKMLKGITTRLGKPFYYQDYLATAPRFQGQRIGARVLERQFEALIPDFGTAFPVVLNTYAVAARRFYRREGFAEMGYHLNGAPVWWYVSERDRPEGRPDGLRDSDDTSGRSERVQLVADRHLDWLQDSLYGRVLLLLVGAIVYPLVILPLVLVCMVWRQVFPSRIMNDRKAE